MPKNIYTEEKNSETDSLNPAHRAAKDIDDVLEDNIIDDDIVVVDEKLLNTQAEQKKILEDKQATKDAMVDANEAIIAEQLIVQESNREHIRVLVLTRDTLVLRHGSVAQQRFLEYSRMFSEVHVIVLCSKGESANEPDRIESNVWVYPTNSSSWWKSGFDAYGIAKKQLSFAGGFRVDLIISEGPFESAVVGHKLSKKYSRAFQVHVLKDFTNPNFKNIDSSNNYRLLIANWIFRRVQSVRVISESVRENIVGKYKNLDDIVEVLPRYYDLDGWRAQKPVVNLKEKYKNFKFILLHNSFGAQISKTDVVLRGVARLLNQYPTIGLVILIDKMNVRHLEDEVQVLGIQNSVVFEYEKLKFVSYIKTANVVIQISGLSDEDHMILCSADVGTPLIVGDIGIAKQLFVDGESAFLCPNDNATCIGEKINKLLNGNQFRVELSRYSKIVITDRIEQDYGAYLEAYRDSIEMALNV